MATETFVQEDVQKDASAWSGGKEPFKASYGKLMMWYFLLSDAFTFAGFLIAYGALRFSMPSWPVPDYVFSKAPGLDNAPLIFVTFMTFVLIVSSVTMVRAVQEGHRENQAGVVRWMVLTIIGGLIFLSCQAWEWTMLIKEEGTTVTKNPFSNHPESGTYASAKDLEAAGFSQVEAPTETGAVATYYLQEGAADLPENRFFVKKNHEGEVYAGRSFEANDPYLVTKSHETHLYEYGAYKTADGTISKEALGPKAFGGLFFFITGFHGFHVLSGIVFLIIITMNVGSGLYAKRGNGYEMVEKIGLYWHFVDLVWVFVFLVFYLL
jgi:cytochrome c oxidase subunit III